MADSNLNEPVIIQATRLDTSVLPRNIFSQSYLLYVIAQGTDVGNVANKANEAGKGAYDAQVKALLQIMKQGLRLPKQTWLITRRELLPMNLS